MNIKEKLIKLRELMKEHHIDVYYVPTNDYHLSEYVGDYFKEREYISSFSGSAGEVLITLDEAHVYVDGRYFLQADQQMAGTEYIVEKLGEKNVKSVLEYLKDNVKDKTIAFDFKTMSVGYAKRVEEIAKLNNLKIENKDLISLMWEDRPAIKASNGFVLSTKYTGRSVSDKLNELKNHLRESRMDATIIASLDDIMYLFNIRGSDVDCNPVLLSYAFVSLDKTIIYINDKSLNEEMKKHFAENDVEIRDYYAIYDDCKKLKDLNITIHENKLNYDIYNSLQGNKLTNKISYVTLAKAKKNETEIVNMRKAHIKDAVALIKFIHYFKTTKDELDELKVVDKLHQFRKENDTFLYESFETIAGWAEHGAIIHYAVDEESSIKISNDNFLLLDSGGQYLEGTTDITRTIVKGQVDPQMKEDFTLVLKGHLRLSNAIFIKGMNGAELDILARAPLFEKGKNYKHGTGHGVGCLLNVHEGPNNISYGRVSAILEEGMITSNEPGLYIPSAYGIRHESLILTKKYLESEYGNFLCFETLTLVPFDKDGIDISLLSKEEIDMLNAYHQKVYDTMSPYFEGELLAFLKEACSKIG